MFKFDGIDLQRFVIAGIGALVLSATCVGATIAPAQAQQAQSCLLVSHA